MSYIDIFILIIVVVAAISGFSKGLIIGMASLAGLVLGIVLSLKFAGYVEIALKNMFDSHSVFMYIIAFAVCFGLVVLAVHAIAKSIEKVVEIAALGFLNRLGGAAFGILKALFLLSALIYFITLFSPDNQLISPLQKEKSRFYKPLEGFLPAVLPFLNEKLKELNDEPTKKESAITISYSGTYSILSINIAHSQVSPGSI